LEILLSFFHELMGLFTDLPTHLAMWVQMFGPWFYVILFAIIFAETGLVVTPILPGDSLLFAVGALCALPNGPSVALAIVLMIIAAILGDAVNYSIGRWFGVKLFIRKDSLLFNPAHLEKTRAFYDKHGGRTIILARFMPIIRTYAPFVAGLSHMNYRQFAAYNVVGGIAWIVSFTVLGYLFGNLPAVKDNFHYVIAAIIIVSVMPIAIEFLRSRRAGVNQKATEGLSGGASGDAKGNR